MLAAPDGTVLANAELAHVVDRPAPGFAEQDADRVWWADVVSACRTITGRAPARGAEIGSITVSGLGPCLVPCDADVSPLRPGTLYGIDTPAQAEIVEVNGLLGEPCIVRRGGSALSSQAVGPKIL